MAAKPGRRKGAISGTSALRRTWGFVRGWWLAILAVLLILSSDSGADIAATAFFVVVAGFAALFAYWRRRLSRSDVHLPFEDVAVQVFRARFLIQEWPRACHDVKLSRDYRSKAPRLGVLRLRDDGTIVSVCRVGSRGVTYEMIRAKAGDLAQNVGAYSLEVRDLRGVTPSGKWKVTRTLRAMSRKSGVVELRFFWEDGLGRLMRLRELGISPEGQISYGRTRNRQVVTVKQHLSLLCFGMSGYGKSNFVWTLLADLIRSEVPTRLYLSDPKKQELAALGRQVGHGSPMFEVRRYAQTERDTGDMIRACYEAMCKRQQVMADRGEEKHVPTVESPLTVLVLDEFLELSPQLKKEDSPLRKIATQGRAAGYVIWGLSQDPVMETIGGIRRLFPQRVAFRLDGESSCKPALGSYAPAHDLEQEGRAFGFRQGDRAPVECRVPLVSSSERQMIARGRVPEMPGEEIHDPHRLYRYWGVLPVEELARRNLPLDWAGQELLLYIGKVKDSADRSFTDRDREHRRDAWWYQYVTRSDASEKWPSKRTVEVAEKAAIEAEGPLGNVQHNLRDRLRRRSRAARDRVAA